MERADRPDSGVLGPFPTVGADAAGRVYAIPFETVWRAALGLVSGGLHGWSLAHQTDVEGVRLGDSPTAIRKSPVRVTIRIGLDTDAQTRVEVDAAAAAIPVFGAGRRGRERFLRALDHVLADRSAPDTA